jgi:hypothetical protein
MSARLAITGVVAIALAAPACAAADGLPLPVDDAGPSGVVSADGGSRYVTIPAGRRGCARAGSSR